MIAQQISQMNFQIEQATRSGEFVALCRHLLATRGRFSAAAAAADSGSRVTLSPRLREICKAAVSPAPLASLADYSAISQGFLGSLANASAFDRLLPDMTPVPVRTGTIGNVTVAATAYSLGEGSAKPVSRISVANTQQNPNKVHCALVVSSELARFSAPQATAFLGRELRNAVATITDQTFIGNITAGVSRLSASGSNAESVFFDIFRMLQSMTSGSASKLFIITTSAIAKTWACMGSTSAGGPRAFPDLTPMCGTVLGIPLVISDGVLQNDVILCDASGVAAGSGDLVLSEFQEGIFQSDSTPDSPVSGTTNYQTL